MKIDDCYRKFEVVQKGETFAFEIDLMELKFKMDELVRQYGQNEEHAADITRGFAAFLSELGGFACSLGSAYKIWEAADTLFAESKKNTTSPPA